MTLALVYPFSCAIDPEECEKILGPDDRSYCVKNHL
jgi:hypothetical protein